MIVRRDFRLGLGDEYLLRLHGESFARLLERPAVRGRLRSVLEEVEGIAEPTVCYDVFPVEKVLHDRLQLAGGHRIGGGQLVSVVGGAEQLYVALCTLGQRFDERLRQKRAEGRYLEMLLLDELGGLAIDQLREQLYEQVQGELAERGFRASSPLSPGDASWPLREQRVIFKLLDATEIGISLGPSFVMAPLKSLSLVFGAGTVPMGVEGLTTCELCSIRERCQYAHARSR